MVRPFSEHEFLAWLRDRHADDSRLDVPLGDDAAMLGGADDEDDETDPDRMYVAKHGHDLVHGSSPYADPNRPV